MHIVSESMCLLASINLGFKGFEVEISTFMTNLAGDERRGLRNSTCQRYTSVCNKTINHVIIL